MDGMRHLSVSVREHMSFEREALRRASLEEFPLPSTSSLLSPPPSASEEGDEREGDEREAAIASIAPHFVSS